MKDNEIISNQTLLNSNDILLSKTYLYFNKYNNMFYIILTDKNNSNYITQSIKEYQYNQHYISGEYSIEFNTYEVV
jgi:hypothetical protein